MATRSCAKCGLVPFDVDEVCRTCGAPLDVTDVAAKPLDEPANQLAAIPQVIVTGMNLPFWSLVKFSIKLTFAAIPAAIIVAGMVSWVLFMIA